MSYTFIRSATDEDGAELARLIAGVFADYDHCFFDDDEFPELKHPASYYAAMGGQMWVAEQDGNIVGSLAIGETLDSGIFELHKVYVAKEARGQGLAWSMYNLATDLVDSRQGTCIKLWTDTRFVEGHQFYDKIGFEKVPVIRYLGDISHTWEYCYRLEAH
ncbi:GNAT family N-acetyltransferase [Cohaesibacter celericrescens]|jgi:putative acetyltransferase|uniref:GNAT family N-acetyltransferase n=1 Tax=Cohaesibacter celericrescens TaxID=2067669 RepID=A0A2N5XKN8_9HYPH|nr:GNAT family N-acetyltransferase [Cohaesibacter celericrescens]PLW75035.1 GNAT family N-acetyltransferase [Cohaesibacter celericrescens]